MEVRDGIGRALGLELPGTLVFDYPTISAISAFAAALIDSRPAEQVGECVRRLINLFNSINTQAEFHRLSVLHWEVSNYDGFWLA